MLRSGSSDLAKGKKFLNQLLYVQHVDKGKDTVSEIPELFFYEYLLTDREIFSSFNFTTYLSNPKANLEILKSSLKDDITKVIVYSNPLPIPIKSDVTVHAFVVFETENEANSKVTWWSLEKNGHYIVLQQSPNKDDVTQKIYNAEKKETKRLEPVRERENAVGNYRPLEGLLRALWETSQLSNPYHLLISNCQNFTTFVFEKSTFQENKWSTPISSTVDRFKSTKIKSETGIAVDAVKYNSIVKTDKFVYYKAIIEGNRTHFEELANHLTKESLNSVDAQGYTLLEWATAFSTSPDLPFDQFLKDKGAEKASDEKLFRQNVFFIALQCRPPNKEANSTLLSFNGIDMKVVNATGDTALHLALYGEKWETVEKMLSNSCCQDSDCDVNVTNSKGDTPLHLAVLLKCKISLFKRILARTNSNYVNKTDRYGSTALHYAISNKSEIAVAELLKREDVDVNVENNNKFTVLHLASKWRDIPITSSFQIILKKSADINAKDNKIGNALHIAISYNSETALEELLKHKDVDVNIKYNDDSTLLQMACWWPNIPIRLFKQILEKSDNVNAQTGGATALHAAIMNKSVAVIEELLKHKDLDVNLNDGKNFTVLHYASAWPSIPTHLFKKILGITADINAQSEIGSTALHMAIDFKSKTAVKELLKHKDVDVNVKTNKNRTALICASGWPNIPAYLLKMIADKIADTPAQNKDE
jgi:ankyrin repeat protein